MIGTRSALALAKSLILQHFRQVPGTSMSKVAMPSTQAELSVLENFILSSVDKKNSQKDALVVFPNGNCRLGRRSCGGVNSKLELRQLSGTPCEARLKPTKAETIPDVVMAGTNSEDVFVCALDLGARKESLAVIDVDPPHPAPLNTL